MNPNQIGGAGLTARQIMSIVAPNYYIPPDIPDTDIMRVLASIIEPELPKRKKLREHNTIEDAVNLIRSSRKILVVSGAGISTSAGLPDFRSRNGIYVQIHEQHPDLSDPKSIFDIDYFRKNPLPFYQFAKALFPGQFQPTVGHQFIRCLEEHDKLLRNYTQNIDTLEKQAGIKRVVECHGSFATASCTSCRYSIDGMAIREDVFQQSVPKCPRCASLPTGPQDCLGVMKPDIVFFGEPLGKEFHDSLDLDKENTDLVIVIGSSLKVRPVAMIPRAVPPSTPQILINREPLDHMSFDIELLGDCDQIVQELCIRLGEGWTRICQPNSRPLKQVECFDRLKHADIGNGCQANPPTQNNNGLHNANSSNQEAIDNFEENGNDDDEWEDIEVIDEKVDLLVPEQSFIHLKPNRYFFKGAELTRDQFDSFNNSIGGTS